MHEHPMYCVLAGALVGGAVGYFYGEYHHKNSKKKKMSLDSIVILPKGMERKAKKILGGVKKSLEDLV